MIEILGYLATALIVIAYLPQVIQTYKKKTAKGINIAFLVIMTLSCSLWIVYAIMISSIPLVLTNILSLMQVLFLMYYKLKY